MRASLPASCETTSTARGASSASVATLHRLGSIERLAPPLHAQAHKEDGFRWWVQRLSRCFQLHDEVRIDHFRGFAGALLAAVCARRALLQELQGLSAPSHHFAHQPHPLPPIVCRA